MPTILTKTIGALRTYTTISAWESATDYDLVGSDVLEIGEMYDDGDFSVSNQAIGSATTDTTHYRILRAALGHEYNPVTDTGVWLSGNSSLRSIRPLEYYLRLQGFGIENTGDGDVISRESAGRHATYDSIYAENSSSTVAGFDIIGAYDGSLVINCIARGGGGSNGASYGIRGSRPVFRIFNCLAIDVDRGGGVGIGINNHYGNAETINCISVNSGDQDFSVDGTYRHNASSDSTATGTGSITSISAADVFNDPDNNDFRLQPGVSIIDAGENLDYEFSNSFDPDANHGDSSGFWNIGPYDGYFTSFLDLDAISDGHLSKKDNDSSITASSFVDIQHLELDVHADGLLDTLFDTYDQSFTSDGRLETEGIVLEDFPDATNTGLVGAGISVGSLTPSAGFNIVTDGQVVELLDISGQVNVQANNVTIRKCRITGGIYGIRATFGYTGLVVEDCEIRNGSSKGFYGNNATIRRCNIHRYVDGLYIPGGEMTIVDCYVHDLAIGETTHNDGLQCIGGSNCVVRHNTIIAQGRSTSCMLWQTSVSTIDNILVQNNLLSGGSYILYFVDKGNGYGAPTNVTVDSNIFVRDSWGSGPLSYDGSPTFTCNVYDDGEPLSQNPACDQTYNKNATANGLLIAQPSTTLNATADGVLQSTNDADATSDGALQVSNNDLDVSSDGILGTTTDLDAVSDGVLRKTNTVDISSDGILQSQNIDWDATSDAALSIIDNDLDITSDSILKKFDNDLDIVSDAAVQETNLDLDILSDGLITDLNINVQISADGLITISVFNNLNASADAAVQSQNQEISTTSDGFLIFADQDLDTTADGVLFYPGQTVGFTASALVVDLGVDLDITADCSVRELGLELITTVNGALQIQDQEIAHTADARLFHPNQNANITSDGLLKHVKSITVQADGALREQELTLSITASARFIGGCDVDGASEVTSWNAMTGDYDGVYWANVDRLAVALWRDYPTGSSLSYHTGNQIPSSGEWVSYTSVPSAISDVLSATGNIVVVYDDVSSHTYEYPNQDYGLVLENDFNEYQRCSIGRCAIGGVLVSGLSGFKLHNLTITDCPTYIHVHSIVNHSGFSGEIYNCIGTDLVSDSYAFGTSRYILDIPNILDDNNHPLVEINHNYWSSFDTRFRVNNNLYSWQSWNQLGFDTSGYYSVSGAPINIYNTPLSGSILIDGGIQVIPNVDYTGSAPDIGAIEVYAYSDGPTGIFPHTGQQFRYGSHNAQIGPQQIYSVPHVSAQFPRDQIQYRNVATNKYYKKRK